LIFPVGNFVAQSEEVGIAAKVLGRDPLKEDPSTLITIPVERTIAGGKWTYEA
jgi:hypothetical protein